MTRFRGAWPRSAKARLRFALGMAIGIAGLVWIFHDVRLSDLRRDIAGVRWAWIVPALLCDTCGYCLQGARWSLLLRPLGRLGSRRATQAVYAGLFVNETLPMRVGEVVRAGLVARWLHVPTLSILSTLALERLFDGFWLALYIGIVAVAVPLPRELMQGADLLGIVVLAGIAVFLVLLFGPAPGAFMPRLVAGPLSRLRLTVLGIGRAPTFFPSFVLSALPQAAESLALWLLLRAYGIPLSVWAGIAAALILRLGTAIPSAPGNVGTWQLVCVLALTVLGVPKAQAAGFSLVAFVLLTVPLWALGWWALARAGLTLATALPQRPGGGAS